MPIKKGDKVKLDYEGTLDDGTVFDSSKHGDHSHPLEFEVGSGMVIPGFDKAVIGMKKGQEKKFKVKPAEAYGEYNPAMTKKIPRNQLPPQVQAGMILVMSLPNGAKFPLKILEINDEEVTVDMNHPLAGKTLTFKIKVLEC